MHNEESELDEIAPLDGRAREKESQHLYEPPPRVLAFEGEEQPSHLHYLVIEGFSPC